MSLSKVSIQKLRRVKKAILAEPRLYDQSYPPEFAFRFGGCEAPCCLEGWALWNECDSRREYAERLRQSDYGMEFTLGVTEKQARELFQIGEGKGPAWLQPKTKKAALHVAELIEDFITRHS